MADEVIRSFRDLHAWQTAMGLALLSYSLAKRLRLTERFELSGQVRRSAVSVPSNIAEGQSCGEDGRYLHHLRIAQGSSGELETELEIARRLGFISQDEYGQAEELFRRTGQLLHGLARSLKRRRLQRIGQRSAVAVLALVPIALYVFRQAFTLDGCGMCIRNDGLRAADGGPRLTDRYTGSPAREKEWTSSTS